METRFGCLILYLPNLIVCHVDLRMASYSSFPNNFTRGCSVCEIRKFMNVVHEKDWRETVFVLFRGKTPKLAKRSPKKNVALKKLGRLFRG